MWRYFVLRSSMRFSHKDYFGRRSLISDSSFRAFLTNSIPNSSSLAIKASSNSRSSLLHFSASKIFSYSSSICFLHEAMSWLWPSIFSLFFCFVCSNSITLLVDSGGIPSSCFSTSFFFNLGQQLMIFDSLVDHSAYLQDDIGYFMGKLLAD